MKSKLLNYETKETIACPSVAATSKSINKMENLSGKSTMMKFKKNTASILRAGAIVTKAIKVNDSMVNDLMIGGNNPLLHKLHVQKVIRGKHERDFEEIERRHLLGLISCEEAKMAKIEAVRAKQKIANELKCERNRLRNFIKSEHEKSVSKSKLIVRKIHLSRLVTKRKKFDLNYLRRINVENVKNFKEQIRREVRRVKEAENQQKLEIVRKMKAKKKSLPKKLVQMNMSEVKKLFNEIEKLHFPFSQRN